MKTYKLENLTCAHCAATIEERLNGLPSVRSARLQFATLDLHLDTSDFGEVLRTIESIEPGVKVVEPVSDSSAPKGPKVQLPWLGLSAGTGFLGLFLVLGTQNRADQLWLALGFGVVYLGAGWPVLRTAVRNLFQGQILDENFLMAVATAAAWVVGAGPEAASVMIFYQWGELFQGWSVNRSRRSLGALLASRPRTVRVLDGNLAAEVDPETVSAGTTFEVRAGESVPLDGEVLKGTGALDTSALTGESLPRTVAPGDEVSAGSVNQGAVLVLRASRPFRESAWAGIVDSVDRALAGKAPLDRFITRFARVYTPVVLILSAGLFVTLTSLGVPWHDSLYRSLVLLVISCPCALVVSIPLTYLGAIGAASRQGFLVRDPGALDLLARVDAAAFDKTGTLTEGKPRIRSLVPSAGEPELRRVLDAGLAGSSHPLARVWGALSSAPESLEEIRGQGVLFRWEGTRAGVGRRDFLESQGFPGVPEGVDSHMTVHAATDLGYLGRVDFDDPAKADTPEALGQLRSLGVGKIALLSGDVPRVAEAWGREWNLEEARGGLLPGDKLAFVDQWEQSGHTVLFVGDGLNDAPVLARASVGVSLGTGASAAAIETADVAVLDGSPRKVPELVRLGRRTRTILYQNIGLALGLKVVFMVLGGLGLAGLWEAVFADVGVALLAVANSLRAAKKLA